MKINKFRNILVSVADSGGGGGEFPLGKKIVKNGNKFGIPAILSASKYNDLFTVYATHEY